jgi:hypothetical protein
LVTTPTAAKNGATRHLLIIPFKPLRVRIPYPNDAIQLRHVRHNDTLQQQQHHQNKNTTQRGANLHHGRHREAIALQSMPGDHARLHIGFKNLLGGDLDTATHLHMRVHHISGARLASWSVVFETQ